jgi:hypothetical protein
MNRPEVIENLGILAARAELEAARLDASPVLAGDYERLGTHVSPSQLSAPALWRQRAQRYRNAQMEMLDPLRPYPFEHVLDPRPSKALVWTVRLTFIGSLGLLIYLAVIQ